MNLDALHALYVKGSYSQALATAERIDNYESPTVRLRADFITTRCLHGLGRHQSALSAAEATLDFALSHFSADDTLAIEALSLLAHSAFRAGSADKATESGRLLVEAQTKAVGPFHSKTLRARAEYVRYQWQRDNERHQRRSDQSALTRIDAVLQDWARVDPGRNDASHRQGLLLYVDILRACARKAVPDTQSLSLPCF